MKKVIIIQARMSSSRLPGKILMDLQGRPMLAQQICRLKECQQVDEIVVATTVEQVDQPVVELAKKEGVAWFCGSEDDVLSRFVGASRKVQADVVVRVTADCPLIDPGVTDHIISQLVQGDKAYDYASNLIDRRYPRGLDAEAFFADVLYRMDRMATSQPSREHVTVFIRAERPDLFLINSVIGEQDNSDLRWTVDTDVDMALIQAIYRDLDAGNRLVRYAEVLQHVRSNPDYCSWNQHVETWNPA